ncbi:YggS family pyridoxal phosphate-dependent enzyme [Aegicerativicinus sediminis]|uniref:YggS family pyridoxal phosphate-dependent enzyme n=1 Tax=Aegicerativicinus sediminis TaxID=2893202 RepID=UPI001E5EFE6E|nr:YggS family pyridoxal phosphate-dependent enzyme [Aegicerativicinus sediminis]
MSITNNLVKLKNELANNVTLVAVSKTKPLLDIQEAYDTGHRHFGENKIQEMVEKYEQLPKDIKWHMIGHVQRNKVKYMTDFVHLIHGVDSFKLLKEINKQAIKSERIIDCLFQIKIAKEDSKFGMDKADVLNVISSAEFAELKAVNIKGLMGMATFTENESVIKEEFTYLKDTFEEFKELSKSNFNMEILSMGMSGDYQLAIECGSNMVRIGSTIFGERNYN